MIKLSIFIKTQQIQQKATFKSVMTFSTENLQ